MELAQRGRPRVFAVVDTALRHLPHMREIDMLRPFGAPTDKDEPVAVEHHGADAGTIGQGFDRGHLRPVSSEGRVASCE